MDWTGKKMSPKPKIKIDYDPAPEHPGRIKVTNLFNDTIKDFLKKYPGVNRYGDDWTLLVPIEVYDFYLTPYCERNNIEIAPYHHLLCDKDDERLHTYQNLAAQMAWSNRKHRITFEMGLGKSLTALMAAKWNDAQSILIFCPAISRRVWAKEFKKWWPDYAWPIHVHESGKSKLPERGTVITSYHLAHTIPVLTWDAIVIDECHHLANPKAQWWEMVKAQTDHNPLALILELTGTPIPNEQINLWGQLEVMCPGRFGNEWEFAHRYCKIEQSQYGKKIVGSKREDELKERLSHFSSRKTLAEVAHLIPKLTTQNLFTTDIDDAVTEKVREARDSGIARVAVLTHYRDSTARLAAKLRNAGTPVFSITGAQTSSERHKVLDSLPPECILVATFHSINTSVDLTSFHCALFAELYSRPSTMLQSIGRFARLSGTLPVQMFFLIAQGSRDEQIALMLAEKIEAINKTIKPGSAETVLADNVTNTKGFDDWVTSQIGAGEEWDEYL